jgi:hypothetical protein
MTRRNVRPMPIDDPDPVRWFARFERAVREQDYPLAAVARDRLFSLGWRVEHAPLPSRDSYLTSPRDRQTEGVVTS